jgi:pimeloyl-ACP methyl ester carboxylesterase
MDDVSTAVGVRRGYADSVLGPLHFAEAGTGPVLLLLHQTPRSHDEFREVLPLLTDGRRVIAMDMLGFGMSASVPAPQSIERMASGALALLDALGVTEAAVLGHHTGAAVAIEMAAQQPARVPALVLSSTPWTGPEYRSSHGERGGVDEAEPADDGSHLTTLWRLRRPYYPAGRPDLLDRFIRDALAPGVDPAEGHRACARYVMEDRITLVRAPVLLIGASADPFAMPQLATLRDRLTNARSLDVRVIEGGMIPLMEQAPADVADVVHRFLRALSR